MTTSSRCCSPACPKLNYTGPKLADVLRLNLDDPGRDEPEPTRRARRRHAGLAERPPPRRRRDRHRRAGGRRLPEGREAAARRRRQRGRRRTLDAFPYVADPKTGFDNTKGAPEALIAQRVPAGRLAAATRPHRTAHRTCANQARRCASRRIARRKPMALSSPVRWLSALGLGGLLRRRRSAELALRGAGDRSSPRSISTRRSRARARRGTATAVARLERALARTGRATRDRLDELGLAYQLRWRETGDAVVPAALRARTPASTRRTSAGRVCDARARQPGADPARLSAARSSSVARHVAVAPFAARPYGVVGDALIELGRYRAGIRDVRPDGRREAEPRLLRAHRLRARAARRPPGAVAAMKLALDAAGGVPEPTAWAHVELGEARRSATAGSRSRGRTSRRADDLSRIRPRARAARHGSRPLEASLGAGGRHRAARRRGRAAPAVRRVARRPARSSGPDARRRRASGRRWRPSTGCWTRTALRVDLESAVFRADHRIRPAETVASRPARPGRATVDLRRRRARLGARARRTLRRGRARGSTARSGSGRRTRSSTSIAGTRRAAPATERRCARWYRDGRSTQSPAFSVRWAPVAPRGALMKRLAALAAALVVVGVAARRAAGRRRAHPLGNFTVNHYAGHRARRQTGVYVRYVLDLAEIPTFQEGEPRPRAPGYAAELARELELRVDGKRVAAVTSWRTACRSVPERAACRPCASRLIYAAPLAAVRAHPSPIATFASRIGWREITVARPRRGAPRLRVRAGGEPLGRAALVSARPPSLAARRSGRRRRVSSPGRRAAAPPLLDRSAAPGHTGDGLEALIGRDDTDVRGRPALLARRRRSGVPRTPSRPGTGRRSSPATSSAPAAGRGTPSRSGPRSRSPTRRACSRWVS